MIDFGNLIAYGVITGVPVTTVFIYLLIKGELR